MKDVPMPSNSAAERGVISCLLAYPKTIRKVADRLKPGHFTDDAMATIYEAAKALYERGKLPTIPNVAAELVRREMRGLEVEQVQWELQEIEDSLAILTSIEDHADVVLRVSKNRRLLHAAAQIADAAYRQEDNSVALAEELITAIAMDGDIRAASSMSDMLDRYQREYEQRRQDHKDGKTIGVRTGFRGVDQLTGGFRPSTLNILAARTSIGKTALALNITLNIIKKAGGRVLFFSLEMKESELIQRFLSMENHVDQILLRDGQTTDDEHADILGHIEALRPLDFHAIDNAYRLDTIKSIARVMHTRKPLDLVVVDYLQLIDVPPAERGRQKARYEELGDITKGLKRTAQELNVPFLVLAQISREGGKSSEPDLTHLGESGRIENDADSVAIIHVTEGEMEKRSMSLPYMVEYLVKKERNGRLGKSQLMFVPPQTRFADPEWMGYQ